MSDNSCVGCKFLYVQDEGYSNYTVENSEVRCAHDRNKSLPADRWNPFDERHLGGARQDNRVVPYGL